ncbi:Nif3-like dinuclear metal center hexameric protein [Lentilactobacillus sp. Marseille-Q4993]|uniref:Nif3-like dinuclear metal center hexameric protein n=1 Tax=Lentilactobacillus sp. Marseille-Q4993 TaxID=3039492 RepID=UPI0024BC5FA3|nr:Nif3-like dinuclear metal center hexameric protein [Lentilactobacillus sp. Marseille-Q4993]
MKVQEIVDRFEKFAPKHLAMDGDPVGLQLGSLDAEVHKVMTTLDVRPEVVQEAIDNGVDFIFAHHPVMFRPAKNLDLSDPQNQMYADILKHNITVYAAHTNLDFADGGMNDWLAEQIGLHDVSGLVPGYADPVYRLTVQVPKVYAAAVRMSLVDAGADVNNSEYTGYTYAIDGTVYYIPKSTSDPTIGPAGEPTEMEDSRLEFEVFQNKLDDVLKALYDVHPLDKPLYNIIKLEDKKHQMTMGRIGTLDESMTLADFANNLKSKFNVNGLRVIANDLNRQVKRVAVLGGDGGKFYQLAQSKGADVYVTGDVYYHTGHDMLASDMPVIDPGHHIESICKSKLARLFNQWKQENGWDIDISESQLNTDPFTFI